MRLGVRRAWDVTLSHNHVTSNNHVRNRTGLSNVPIKTNRTAPKTNIKPRMLSSLIVLFVGCISPYLQLHLSLSTSGLQARKSTSSKTSQTSLATTYLLQTTDLLGVVNFTSPYIRTSDCIPSFRCSGLGKETCVSLTALHFIW